ncbi:D-2-hydroxyacid dehydrogenase [Thiohalobacter sp.]|uniref:D-2-hydroxyacid dehydrogenase n=1 Tax=Thiohalobacter sp. TaxID=2025948 RepID=UPI0026052C58|nr:D-2-hydroxyacid dehydrogenase [Thiohalobacter sp.]
MSWGRLHHGVMLDLDSLHPADLDLGRLKAALPHWDWHLHTKPEQTAARIGAADVVVTNKVVLDAARLDAAPRLRLICVAATGMNNIDLAAAEARGIAVRNVRNYASQSVAEHVFALILALKRRLAEHRQAALTRWPDHPDFCILDHPMTELAGRRLGIVGYGDLGRAVARIGEAFGMKVLKARRPGGRDDRPGRLPLDTLLERSDVVSLHCPLTEATRGLIGRRELRLMQPHALLINTARGGIVDEVALAQALREGVIAGAGVDVLSEEPPPRDNPLLATDIPNLILTPHVAWASREARQRLVDQVAANIEAFAAT